MPFLGSDAETAQHSMACTTAAGIMPELQTCRSKTGFKDTAAFKATAKKLAPVKAAVRRAAAATMTAVASALHTAVGFVGGPAASFAGALKARAGEFGVT